MESYPEGRLCLSSDVEENQGIERDSLVMPFTNAVHF